MVKYYYLSSSLDIIIKNLSLLKYLIKNRVNMNKESLTLSTFPVGRGTTPAGVVYVYQNNNHIYYRSIVNPNIIVEDANNHTIIYPQTDFNSKRKSRHFYNNASFKYLEHYTEDYEFKKILTI